MGEPITDITIVGGGTAGWLAAAFLNHRLQWGEGARPGMRVTVIESPDVPTIGVGEATVPTLRQTLSMMEIDEDEFITRTDATFKLGIRFNDWNVDETGQFTSFFHPFGGGAHVHGRNPGYSFAEYGASEEALGCKPDFCSLIAHAPQAADLRKGPRIIGGPQFVAPQQYAYHLDAGKFAAFMAEVAIARGVERVFDTLVGVERDERGLIAALKLRDGGDRPVQLVIDCTGFRGLLINGHLEEPFVSFGDYLLNDRAVPIQVAHASEPDLYSATISTARRAGWSWRIPLQSRIGTGYVFSSSFIDDDEAIRESHMYLGDEKHLTPSRVLPMRVGHSRRSWVGNCVAIGLSSGFVEPLESTGIQFVEVAVRRLAQLLPSTDFETPLIDKFNQILRDQYEEVRDFLSLHFSLSNRDDTPYWNAVRYDARRSDVVKEQLEFWRYAMPDNFSHRPGLVFNAWSQACILFGKGFYGATPLAGSEVVAPEAWQRYVREWGGLKKVSLQMLPQQGELLRTIAESVQIGKTAAQAPHVRRRSIGGAPLGLASILQPMPPVAAFGKRA